MNREWLRVPVGRDAAGWVTARTQRTVLAVVHTVAGAGHVMDAVELLECDLRIQVIFTQAPDLFSNGVAEFLHDLDAVVITWHQAIQVEVDLVVAADCAGLQELPAPVLLLAHGVMNNKLAPAPLGGPASGLVVGLGTPWLTWYGRLVPAAVALSHADLVPVLDRQCPQALPAATVVGDLCLDRLVASLPDRRRYRQALGIPDGRILVAVSSTWGPHSLFARCRALLDQLVAELPGQHYSVVAGLHPALWFGHGPRQVMGWLGEQRRRGLRLVDPLSWRGLVVAADVLVGDHGSATIYAAAAGVAVLLTPGDAGAVPPGSAAALLADTVPACLPNAPLAGQLCQAMAVSCAGGRAAIAGRVTSQPGRAARLVRSQMYRLLRLSEPSAPPHTAAVPAPRLVTH
jgi:hypothetical protein